MNTNMYVCEYIFIYIDISIDLSLSIYKYSYTHRYRVTPHEIQELWLFLLIPVESLIAPPLHSPNEAGVPADARPSVFKGRPSTAMWQGEHWGHWGV